MKVSDRKGSAKAIFLAVLAIEFGMFLWLAILFDAPLFTPIHQGVRLLYANVVCSFLQFSLQRKASNVVRIFPRRSSTEKLSSRTFSLFFSDLDIGICVSDKENIAKLRDHFYQLKSRLIFMGELEVYTFREFEELESLEEDIGELYQVLRDMRKIGWIKGQLKTQKRNPYHRYKDHRALKNIKRKWSLRSFHHPVLQATKLLKKYLGNSAGQLPRSCDFSCSVFCPYLFLRVSLSPREPQLQDWLLLLSCTPTWERGDAQLDEFTCTIRKNYDGIRVIFEKLNRLEFLVATAFVRGASKPEDWHSIWLRQLFVGQEAVRLK